MSDLRLIENSDSTINNFAFKCFDPVHKKDYWIYSKPGSVINLEDAPGRSLDDPHFACGVQFKTNTKKNSTAGLKFKVCILEVIRKINITYDLDGVETVNHTTT